MTNIKGFNQYQNNTSEETPHSSESLLSEEQRTKILLSRKITTPTEQYSGSLLESISSIPIPGTQGDPGPSGVPGTRGPQGSPGTDGKDGEPGSLGEQGIRGVQGDQGVLGEQGIQGEKGERGLQGLQGVRGEIGTKGEHGDSGIQGTPGERGEKGIPGQNGKQGVRGEKGIQGKQGVRGGKGTQGKQGTKGPKGDKGIPGGPGTVGKDGKDGEDGQVGEIGDDGIVVAQFPLKYDKDKKKISVDTKVLQKMLSVPPAQAQDIDWVALAGGGAVGVRDRTGSNNLYLLKSVSDLIFKGTGVTLERKGKDIELTFTDTGTYNESTDPPSSPSDGDRWHETDSGKLFTYSNAQSVWIEF